MQCTSLYLCTLCSYQLQPFRPYMTRVWYILIQSDTCHVLCAAINQSINAILENMYQHRNWELAFQKQAHLQTGDELEFYLKTPRSRLQSY